MGQEVPPFPSEEDHRMRFNNRVTRDLGVDIPIVQARTELPGVASLLFFADPDDNWIELVELQS